jgi:hypothetical protein
MAGCRVLTVIPPDFFGPNVSLHQEWPRCASCGRRATDMQRCKACKGVQYCSAACQKQDWPDHKHDCRAAQAAREGGSGGGGGGGSRRRV